jgi:F0F1-type ATP synthase assembly protein I
MNQLLRTSPEEFIPFFAIFFTFMIPILAIYFYHQQKKRVMEERRLMIEKGMTPPPMRESVENFKINNNPMQKGMKLIAIALGLLVGYFISQYFYIKAPFSILGSILFFLGIANVINASMNNKIDHSPLKNDNEKQ